MSDNTEGNVSEVTPMLGQRKPFDHQATAVEADAQAKKSGVAGVASAMRSTPSFRGIVPASGPQYHQRVGSEERLGMATTIAFSSVGVLSSTPAY